MSQNNTNDAVTSPFGRRQSPQPDASRSADPAQGTIGRERPGQGSVKQSSAARIGQSQRDSRGTEARGGALDRINWFDYAKGICIILVVMMHSTLGVGNAMEAAGLGSTGFMHYIVAFAKPFRMPDFFMLSGLFLSAAIGRRWMHYLDKKLVHFFYFYALWMVIQVIIKTGATGGLTLSSFGTQLLDAAINPFPTLWFIYVLPLYFIVTKLLRFVPGWVMLAGAAVLQLLSIHTGWTAIDHFAVHYYVFFLGGYLLAPHIFALANWAQNNALISVIGLAAWAQFNGLLAFTPSPIEGWQTVAALPLVSIALGGMGAVAIVVIASLLAKFKVADFIRYCGQNSIVLYISFTIPMAISRTVLIKLGLIPDVGLLSVTVWLIALLSPLILHLMVRRTPLRFLYERPAWFALPYRARPQHRGRAAERLARVAGSSASA